MYLMSTNCRLLYSKPPVKAVMMFLDNFNNQALVFQLRLDPPENKNWLLTDNTVNPRFWLHKIYINFICAAFVQTQSWFHSSWWEELQETTVSPGFSQHDECDSTSSWRISEPESAQTEQQEVNVHTGNIIDTTEAEKQSRTQKTT